MALSNNNNNYLNPTTLLSLHKAGFKLVPLAQNHTPSISWGPIYENPDYWSIEKLETSDIYSKFINVASTVGKTHIKDSDNKELFIQVLDVDSEPVYNILCMPISQLGISSLFDTLGISEDENSSLTLLDICKRRTFVTKTKIEYGYHIWWFSYNQNKSISIKDCKKDCEFEIKTDNKNGLCTLPPSTHRDDKDFRYLAIGCQDKLWINDKLYNVFYNLFKECLIRKGDNDKDKENALTNLKENSFYNLSSKTIQKSIEILSSYYREGDRNDFALSFSGTAFHSRISEESAAAIIEGICNIKNDLEKQNRIYTLRSTYKNGINGKPVTGTPTLAELIERVSGCDIYIANSIINNLKNIWQKGIPKDISITQAKGNKEGFVKVTGTIIGLSSVYNLIRSVHFGCSNCDWEIKEVFELPKFKVYEKNNCPICSKEKGLTNTVIDKPEYLSVVDLELQDIDGRNEIERLPVRVFEKDTYNIAAGEVVNVVGNLHVIRKNDNIKNKLETFLFADSIEYTKRKELTLTDKDIGQIKEWKDAKIQKGINPIDSLVALFAPELIDLDHVKKGMLLVCASAGLRNIDGSFPKRLRLNALLIGDPGLAKTSILEKTVKLIPNSQFAGGQSSTGLSLTAQIIKEDGGGGMLMIRYGPAAMAKDTLFAINELGQLPIEDHKHLLDCMEENGFPIAKYGYSTFIEAHPSIIASSNPINNKWQNAQTVNTREFPTLHQVIQRFDLIFIFRENTNPSYLARYADRRKNIAEDYRNRVYEDNEEFIKKYLLYARSLNPNLSEEAFSLLKSFYIDMGMSRVLGLPRKLDSLIRITISISKLKLKSIADVKDAQEAITIYNDTLKAFNQKVLLSANLRDISYEQIRKVIKENNGSSISLTDAAIKAAEQNIDVKYYLKIKDDDDDGDIRESLKSNENWHLREILKLFRNDDSMQIVQERPTILRWKGKNNFDFKDKATETVVSKDDNPVKQDQKNNVQNNPCDECDECEDVQKKNILQTNIYSHSIPQVAIKDETNDDINKQPIESNNSSLSVNQINTIEDKTTIEEEEEENNGIGKGNIKIQKIEKLKPSSHPSHPSHSIMIADNSNLSEIDICNKLEYKPDDIGHQQQIQLKHSPFADIYTDKINLKDTSEPWSSSDVKLSG
jgi:replicative DNA helicase Mcm